MKKIIKNKSEKEFRIYTIALFVIYLIILTWGILFKFKFNIFELHNLFGKRTIILKPFFLKDSRFYKFDVFSNILAFVPFGVYLSALRCEKKIIVSILTCIASIFNTSLFYETVQYIFAIGCADVSDLISNTIGGMVGIAIYYIMFAVFRKYTNTVVNIAAGIITVGTAFLITVWVSNGSLANLQNRLFAIFNFLCCYY